MAAVGCRWLLLASCCWLRWRLLLAAGWVAGWLLLAGSGWLAPAGWLWLAGLAAGGIWKVLAVKSGAALSPNQLFR